MIIKITEQDIYHGRRRNCAKCPGALAVNRVLLADYWVSVTYRAAYLFSRFHSAWPSIVAIPIDQIIVPEELVDFILRFDSDGKVEPKAFDLEINKYFVKQEYL